MRNLHLTFDWHYIGQKYGGDFTKFCGLLRIYELYEVSIIFLCNYSMDSIIRPGPFRLLGFEMEVDLVV